MSTNNHKSLGRIDHVDEDTDAISGLNADSENPFDKHCPEGQFLTENLSFGITLGKADGRTVFQFNEDRFRHTAIIGRTGSGKSNHIMQMEREDIRNGAGVAIIAAHEEDALYPLMCVPKERIDDVIILDPTNTRVLPCLNPLDVEPTDKAATSKAVSDCIQLLKSQCYHEWAGPRFDQMARLALETMLDPGFADAVCVEHTKVTSIPCVPASREQLGNHPHIGLIERMYTDPDYVRLFLPKLTSKHLYDQWKLEASSRRSFDADDKVQWFLSKLDPFLCDRVLKNIFGPGKKTIDIKQIVDAGKILVAIIPEHRIGHDAAALLRTWLLMQLKDAILARGALDDSGYFGICSASKRKTQDLDPFFVYVDEFGEQASLEFASFLAEARKYHVGFTLAFQNLAQMSTFDTHAGRESSKLLDAILGNVGTVITYPIGSSDTTLMARQLNVDEREVANIRRYHPLARVLLDNEQRLLTLDVDCKPKPDDPDMPETLADNQIIHNVWLPVRRN